MTKSFQPNLQTVMGQSLKLLQQNLAQFQYLFFEQRHLVFHGDKVWLLKYLQQTKLAVQIIPKTEVV
jgi:hypothetical protein